MRVWGRYTGALMRNFCQILRGSTFRFIAVIYSLITFLILALENSFIFSGEYTTALTYYESGLIENVENLTEEVNFLMLFLFKII